MRPLFRSLFVFSVFSVIAAHVSTGILAEFVSDVAPRVLAKFDKILNTLLVGTLGPQISVYVILAIGAFFALWAFMAAQASQGSRGAERHSTW